MTGRVLLRRARLGVLLCALAGAVGASAVSVNLIAERLAPRLDLTARGDHELSPRTRRLLDALSGEYRVVLAVDGRKTERRVLDRVLDVLDAMDRASDRLSYALIDTSSGEGLGRFRAVMAELIERDRAAIEAQTASVLAACETIGEIAGGLEGVAPQLELVSEAIPASAPNAENNRAYFQQRARVARVRANDLRSLAQQARSALAPGEGSLTDPHAVARQLAQPLAALDRELTGLAEDLERFSGAEGQSADARLAADPPARLARTLRRRAALAGEEVGRIRPTDAARVSAALSRNEGVLVIGPPRLDAQGRPTPGAVSAVDAEGLLLPTDVYERAGIAAAPEVGRRAEDLLATGLASLADPVQPIVVLAHGGTGGPEEQRRFAALFAQLRRRLAVRGIDVLEWAAGEPGAERPRPVELDPTGQRPVVYVVLSPDATSGSGTGDPEQSGARRAQRVGAAVAQLAEEGKPILLSLNPSLEAGIGDGDPIARVLPRYGLAARTSRVILRSENPGGRRVANPDVTVIPEGGADHPVAGAVAGLPMLLPWAIELEPIDGSGATPLVRLPDDDALWSESQWAVLWTTPRDRRALLANQPAPDPAADVLSPEGGSWIVAAAAERRIPAMAEPARLIAVGSNAWFADPFAFRYATVDGRQFLEHPGNVEFFEAAVLWLAGRDDLVAQSTSARAVPLVRISPGALSRVRWALLAGLPGGVLLLGGAYRLLRG